MATDPISAAKGAMTKANDFTEAVEGKTPSQFAVKAKPSAASPAPAKAAPSSRTSMAADNIKAAADVAKGVGMTGVGTLGTFHKGGVVSEDGKPLPVSEPKAQGRDSEYRKVFVARRQARSGGGNKPV